MDKNENKYRYWVFTWNSSTQYKLVPVPSLKKFLEFYTDDYVFQEEKGEKEGRNHYQGVFKTKNRVRQQTCLKAFREHFMVPGVEEELIKNLTIERMQGTWAEATNYCSKEETRVGEVVSAVNREPYEGVDINFLETPERRYPWQNEIYNKVFEVDQVTIKSANDREITWVFDPIGNCGKSKFIKFLCSNSSDFVKITFGTAPQLRSAIISCGPKKVYIIDMPRTLAEEDSIASLISTLEDLKNGFLVSVFYGKYQSLMMEPPHVLVFSNKRCPVNMMSDDRWYSCQINKDTMTLEERYDFI